MADLASLARPATDAPIGGGLANMARGAINIDKLYKQYYMEAIQMGEEPISKEEFAAKLTG